MRGTRRPRLGIIVNPVAGIGGSVALKGSDGADTLAIARRRGGVPRSPARARRALRALRGVSRSADPGELTVLAPPGEMGADLARELGFEVAETATSAEADPTGARQTTADDTREAAAAMRDAGIELLLFAGGDGTARDIYDIVGSELPLLGIPAGVKMHSGVFAPSPEAAGRAGEAFLSGAHQVRVRSADIADVDEQAARDGRLASVLYGSATVPDLPRLVLPAKAGSRRNSDAALDALCATVAAGLEPGCLYLFGPGSTTAAVLSARDQPSTLLGVDAVSDGRLVGRDLTESQAARLVAEAERVRLVVGLVGGQGVLFGRGNHQLGPAVLRQLRRDRIMILSAADKLLALDPPTLWVDTGDTELDRRLSGYVRVDVGPREQIVMNVSS